MEFLKAWLQSEDKMKNILITDNQLDINQCLQWVSSPNCGGIDIFVGTVRNQTKGKKVIKLEFEAYEKMALHQMSLIADSILERWNVEKILIHHAVGSLIVGEIPVIIAVAAPHRDAAFEACRYAIDTLKETVPIWKKEFFEDGEVWVAAHP